jgi:anti-repressor protein
MPDNKPYQKYIDGGYFRVIEQKYTRSDGEIVITFKTLVYQRGVAFIKKLIA